jgi:hypothetical protein
VAVTYTRAVVLLLALAAGVLLLDRLLSSPPPAPSLPRPALGISPATSTAQATSGPRVQPNPQRGEVAVEIGERELSEGLNQRLAGRSLGQTPLGSPTLERVQVALRDGQAQTTGTARLGGASLPFTSSASLAPDAAGRVRLSVADAKLGGIPLPDQARSELESDLQDQVDRLLARQPIRVRSIQVGDGRIRLVGTPGG